jgi:hypothetical protein
LVSSGIFCEFCDNKAAAWQRAIVWFLVSLGLGCASVYRGRGCALGLSLGLQDKNAKGFFFVGLTSEQKWHTTENRF